VVGCGSRSGPSPAVNVPGAEEGPTLGGRGRQGPAGGAALSWPTLGAPMDDLTREGMAGGSGAAPRRPWSRKAGGQEKPREAGCAVLDGGPVGERAVRVWRWREWRREMAASAGDVGWSSAGEQWGWVGSERRQRLGR
jgi:hypothetical protein